MSFVHVYPMNHGKLDPQALKCLFMGYFPTKKDYRCHPTSQKIFTIMDVTFVGNQSFFPNIYLQRENLGEDKFLSHGLLDLPGIF